MECRSGGACFVVLPFVADYEARLFELEVEKQNRSTGNL